MPYKSEKRGMISRGMMKKMLKNSAKDLRVLSDLTSKGMVKTGSSDRGFEGKSIPSANAFQCKKFRDN